MANANLKSVIGDVADSEIPKKELIVKVIKQLSSSEFEIADETGKAELLFKDEAKKRANNIELDKVIKLYGVQKLGGSKLLFTKNSFWVEEKTYVLNVKSESSRVKLKDLCFSKPGDIIKDNISLKCIELKDTSQTVKGTSYKKVTFADEDFVIRATIWREEINKFEKLLQVGSVYVLTNFSIDKYPFDTNNQKPKDINFRYSTRIRKLEDQEIPRDLIDVALPKEISGTKGIIKYVTNVHTYLACPGNGGPCGKSVRENRVCEKCGINLSTATLIQAYKCELVFFGEDDIIYHVTAFSSQLKEFEIEGENVEEKLEGIKFKPASVKMTEKEDSYMLNKLVIQN